MCCDRLFIITWLDADISAVEILVNDQGNRITPSWVAFTDDERLVGDAAKNQFASNPSRTIFDIVSWQRT
jgi:molecular chaperone DnaK (HSP70)